MATGGGEQRERQTDRQSERASERERERESERARERERERERGGERLLLCVSLWLAVASGPGKEMESTAAAGVAGASAAPPRVIKPGVPKAATPLSPADEGAGEELLATARTGDEEGVRAALGAGASPNFAGAGGRTGAFECCACCALG
jgi:hypothetical protein